MTKTSKSKAIVRGNPGRKLERARRKNRFTRQDVAERLNIPVSAVKHLDRWELDNLDEIFKTKQTVRRYALLVGLNPADFETQIPYQRPMQYKFKPMVVFSKLSLSTLAVLAGLLVIGFLGWRTFVATARPLLSIAEPGIGRITNQPTITVTGQTSEQAQVYVNGFNVPVDPEGKFNTSVILDEGANTIIVTAINSFGRKSESKRTVYYSP